MNGTYASEKVDVQLLFRVGNIGKLDRTRYTVSGIAYEYIYSALAVEHRFYRSVYRLFVGYVAAYVLNSGQIRTSAGKIVNAYPARGELPRALQPDTRACAGDNGDLTHLL